MKLWYDQPAKEWEESLPLGNGNFGAMVWGSPGREIIGLNEETLWSGYYKDKNNPEAKKALSEVRELIFKKEYEKAERLISESMLGEYNESYLPLGNLILNFSHQGMISDYHRELDLETAIASVSYKVGEKKSLVEREMFVSYPHQGMFIRVKGPHSLEVTFESLLKTQVLAQKDRLHITGQCPEHVDPEYFLESPEPFIQGELGQHFSGDIQLIETDALVQSYNGQLVLKDGTDTILLVSFVRQPKISGEKFNYDITKAEHLNDYQSIYKKVSIDLGEQLPYPTDKRLSRLREGEEDNGLFGLYFQYGRYLLIASSREGSLPANLQGIWNWEIRAPWSSNWTVNINLQMNYWPAQVCNLQECLEPYFRLLEETVVEGKKTAKVNYDARGFVIHHNLDYWKNANPVGIYTGQKQGHDNSLWWSMWPMGGAWLCKELYKNYEYNKDLNFLSSVCYPILREATLFLLDWLVEYNGEYTTCPSSSPENQFISPLGNPVTMTHGVSFDIQIIRDIFSDFQKTVFELGLEDEVLAEVEEKLSKMPNVKIGSQGQILEWNEEFTEREPGHRHMTHLYGLYPGESFEESPELKEAAKISLANRLKHNSSHIGWSCAWLISHYAVLEEPENSLKFLRQLLTNSTLNNLWDSCPPFQIDGNFGGIVGIANMLVQDRAGKVKILPALPESFVKGSVRGLRLKNNQTIDIEWDNNELVDYKIY